jgi:hypothetical protein
VGQLYPIAQCLSQSVSVTDGVQFESFGFRGEAEAHIWPLDWIGMDRNQ